MAVQRVVGHQEGPMDRSADLAEAVRRLRRLHGTSKPASELLKPVQRLSQFNVAAAAIVRAWRAGG